MRIRLHLELLAQDLHYAVRTLRGTPIFTLTAVLAMVLGIGAGDGGFQRGGPHPVTLPRWEFRFCAAGDSAMRIALRIKTSSS
jgi:hypothetical protein